MFWETIDLDEKSWSYRIQNFTFGSAPFAKVNYCPHFWLAVFCWLVLPFTLLLKPIIFVVKHTFLGVEDLSDFIAFRILRPWWERQAMGMSDREVWMLWLTHTEIQRVSGTNFPAQRKWLSDKHAKFWEFWTRNKDWEKHIEKIRERMEKMDQLEKEKAEKRKALKKNILLGIVKVTKWMVPVVALVLLAACGLGVYAIWDTLIEFWNKIEWAVVGWVVVAFIGLVLTVGLFVRSSDWIKAGFEWIGRGFGAVGDFIGLNVAMFKDNHCPGINWKGK